jgi:hypothetical protein
VTRTNLKAHEREAQIRAMLADGLSDPAEMAVSMRCSKELVLVYARRMPAVAMRAERLHGRGHFRIVLALAERAA